MKKKISAGSIIFFGIAFGLIVGNAFVSGSKIALSSASDYVTELRTSSTFVRSEQGGPQSEEKLDLFEDDSFFYEYNKSYRVSDKAPVPYVDSASFLVGDLDTGDVIISKNSNEVLSIASISKLMTAIVADEELGLDEEVLITQTALDTYGRQGNLSLGEKYKVSEILYPLLLESSNDASEAVAETQSRDFFISRMNEKSRKIEMFSTHFGDPSGLSSKNVSTVSDLFRLAQYIEKYRSYIFDITRKKGHELGNLVWFNNSKFRSDDDYYGGKNGYTDIALKTQLAIFEMNISGEKKKIVFIILKTDDIEGDIYGLKRYTSKYVTYE